jgi:hypothetical protein
MGAVRRLYSWTHGGGRCGGRRHGPVGRTGLRLRRGRDDAAVALQQGFEGGHQPCCGSPKPVAEAAAACALDTPGAIEPGGTNRYRAADTITGESVIVEVAQPLGPGTVWIIASVTAA